MQGSIRVAILGPLGTYSHEARSVPLFLVLLNEILQAAHKVFGPGAIYEEQSSISGYQPYVSQLWWTEVRTRCLHCSIQKYSTWNSTSREFDFWDSHRNV